MWEGGRGREWVHTCMFAWTLCKPFIGPVAMMTGVYSVSHIIHFMSPVPLTGSERTFTSMTLYMQYCPFYSPLNIAINCITMVGQASIMCHLQQMCSFLCKCSTQTLYVCYGNMQILLLYDCLLLITFIFREL